MREVRDPTLLDGRYRLELELGAGAFGTVYKATQVAAGIDLRPVAVKVLNPGEERADLRRRLNDAFQLIAAVSQVVLDSREVSRRRAALQSAHRAADGS